LKPDRFREAVAQNAARLRMNLELTTLHPQMPLPHIGPAEVQTAKLFPLLEKLEMKSSLVEAQKRYSAQAELF
jgi:DNA polymerase-1